MGRLCTKLCTELWHLNHSLLGQFVGCIIAPCGSGLSNTLSCHICQCSFVSCESSDKSTSLMLHLIGVKIEGIEKRGRKIGKNPFFS